MHKGGPELAVQGTPGSVLDRAVTYVYRKIPWLPLNVALEEAYHDFSAYGKLPRLEKDTFLIIGIKWPEFDLKTYKFKEQVKSRRKLAALVAAAVQMSIDEMKPRYIGFISSEWKAPPGGVQIKHLYINQVTFDGRSSLLVHKLDQGQSEYVHGGFAFTWGTKDEWKAPDDEVDSDQEVGGSAPRDTQPMACVSRMDPGCSPPLYNFGLGLGFPTSQRI